MHKISVIVPIYHGKRYIDAMIQQIEANGKLLSEEYTVELVMSNDDPDEALAGYTSDNIDIVVLNTDVNRGIQGARVRGLEACQGEYVVFLDQDDVISPEYLASQLQSIQGYDASVCRAIHEKKPFYNATLPFEKVISLEHMLREGDSIVSPGQVLMKKSAVSEIWKTHILKQNGADDWFLWLCMMKEEKSFALNQQILYEHVVDGANVSWNTEKMLQSELEVFEVLKKTELFCREEIDILESTVQKVKTKHLKITNHFKQMFFVYDKWMHLENQHITISEYLSSRDIKTVAIYGDGYIGKQLLGNLQRDKVDVRYMIDQNAKYLEEEAKLYTLEDDLPQVDLIIVTLLQKENEIKEALEQKVGTCTISIKELLNEMERKSNG